VFCQYPATPTAQASSSCTCPMPGAPWSCPP
jgi:hypothetical protein